MEDLKGNQVHTHTHNYLSLRVMMKRCLQERGLGSVLKGLVIIYLVVGKQKGVPLPDLGCYQEWAGAWEGPWREAETVSQTEPAGQTRWGLGGGLGEWAASTSQLREPAKISIVKYWSACIFHMWGKQKFAKYKNIKPEESRKTNESRTKQTFYGKDP